MYVAFSASPGQEADDGAGRAHSPFAEALGRHLLTPCLDMDVVFRKVRDDVMRGSRTDPPQVPLSSNGLIGDAYYFLVPCGSSPPQAPTAVPASAKGLFRTEVTVAEYRKCVNAGKCTEPYPGTFCNYQHGDRGEHPVNCIDWTQADAYCRWAGARLPTDDEWMAAFTNGGKTKFPWGDEAPTCAKTVIGGGGYGCGRNSTWVACEKPRDRNQAGLCDLGGNVWEWTATVDGSARVLRGGGWSDDASDVGKRDVLGPASHLFDVGLGPSAATQPGAPAGCGRR